MKQNKARKKLREFGNAATTEEGWGMGDEKSTKQHINKIMKHEAKNKNTPAKLKLIKTKLYSHGIWHSITVVSRSIQFDTTLLCVCECIIVPIARNPNASHLFSFHSVHMLILSFIFSHLSHVGAVIANFKSKNIYNKSIIGWKSEQVKQNKSH